MSRAGSPSQPLPRGRRLLVVTNGGGLGIVATDAARDAGLEVAPLEAPVRERLAAVLPPTASLANPVDLVGDADATRYSHALHAIGGAAADAALVMLTAQAATDPLGVARAVIVATRGWTIPVAAAFVGGARVAPGVRALEEAGIPCYPFPEPAVRTLAGMARLWERRGRRAEPARPAVRGDAAAAAVAGLRASGLPTLGMSELEPVLTSYGIAVLPSQAAETAEEAASAAERLGFPVALKLRSRTSATRRTWAECISAFRRHPRSRRRRRPCSRVSARRAPRRASTACSSSPWRRTARSSCWG